MKPPWRLSCAFAVMTGFAHAALAQQPAPPAAPPPQAQQPQPQVERDVTDEDLDTFASIYVELQTLNERFQSELAGVESEAQAQEVQTRLQEESISTIEEHGWSVAQYNAVAQSINADRDLLERTMELIEEES